MQRMNSENLFRKCAGGAEQTDGFIGMENVEKHRVADRAIFRTGAVRDKIPQHAVDVAQAETSRLAPVDLMATACGISDENQKTASLDRSGG